ncbi:hypothetical protein A3H74_01865 [Candidatus Kaiserbacteria bacterium RIFCSPLOWO2_02_FULL_51_13]|uniref:Uncharacterized protein n=1 Tax=Candidatus Kaiserbacteria bacterium RIFCSPLOWO2_01_FULL_50_24 TaxID=1798507 RepID=A0A1F6ERB7_9BACT|nr:MAG: hypothetical protein A3A34_01475 [Candidatus Kaiserbacteria bacterium RIFCSPLOWO2_01_FULL_50_24]OGG81179.1 MAG: hypothetical protein A3H74_01865 [Candidatus Kaiserbacteria bacterium RIFCSPLOWO2_02_FULL_51_13]
MTDEQEPSAPVEDPAPEVIQENPQSESAPKSDSEDLQAPFPGGLLTVVLLVGTLGFFGLAMQGPFASPDTLRSQTAAVHTTASPECDQQKKVETGSTLPPSASASNVTGQRVIQACLPGCRYKVTTPSGKDITPKIEAFRFSDDLNSKTCQVVSCNPAGLCGSPYSISIGNQAAADKELKARLTALAVKDAASEEAAQSILAAYLKDGGNKQMYLNALDHQLTLAYFEANKNPLYIATWVDNMYGTDIASVVPGQTAVKEMLVREKVETQFAKEQIESIDLTNLDALRLEKTRIPVPAISPPFTYASPPPLPGYTPSPPLPGQQPPISPPFTYASPPPLPGYTLSPPLPGQQPSAPPPTYTREEIERIVQERDPAWQRAVDALRGQQQQQPPGGGESSGVGGMLGSFIGDLFGGQQQGQQARQPSCTIVVSPSTIKKGESVTLTWNTLSAQGSLTAHISGLGAVSLQGSTTLSPSQSTTFSMAVLGHVQQLTSSGSGQSQYYVSVPVSTSCTGRVEVSDAPPDSIATAELSCAPKLADIGQSVALAFACRNAKEAKGEGFDTGGKLEGGVTVAVLPPEEGNGTLSSVTYKLMCTDASGKEASNTCTVRVNKTTIVLVANPKEVASGESANIGWVTIGMESCTLSSPQLPAFTESQKNKKNTSGVVKTPSLTQNTDFELACETKAGGAKKATTTVTIK